MTPPPPSHIDCLSIMGPLLFCKLVLSAFLTPSVVLWYTHLKRRSDEARGTGNRASSMAHAGGARALKVIAMFGEIELGDELEINGMWADQLEYLQIVIVSQGGGAGVASRETPP